jgi:lipoyl(octanoyl) transferase
VIRVRSLISVLQLGVIDYESALRLQQSLVELRKAGQIGNVLLLLEHTPVITLGRNASRENIVASAESLAESGVQVFDCDRGGDVTFHGPGQLVGYPIFDLRSFVPRLGAIEYVRSLEEVLIRTCADLGIAAQRISGMTGVWTAADEPAKIAAIGVHISRGITSHGFALNVNTNLDQFRLIVPCGISTRPVTSISNELHKSVTLDEVAHAVSRNFSHVFRSQILWLEALEELIGQEQDMPARAPEELRRLHEEDSTWA